MSANPDQPSLRIASGGPDLLTPADVASMLGISVRTLERRIESGCFPPPDVLAGRRVWRRDYVVDFIALSRDPSDTSAAQARSRGAQP